MLMNSLEILKAKGCLILMKKHPHTLDGASSRETDLGGHRHLQRYAEEWVQDTRSQSWYIASYENLSSDATDKASEVRQE